MKTITTLLLALVMGLSAGAAFAAELQAPQTLAVGQPALVQVTGLAAGHEPQLLFQQRAFPLYPMPGGGYVGIIGADLKTPPDSYVLSLIQNADIVKQQTIKVLDHDYGTRNITVQDKYVEPDAATMERINREKSLQLDIFNAQPSPRYWQGAFIRPLDSVVVGKFGRKSIINGQPRAPHGGVDLRGATGTPIKAIAQGKVALTLDSYFSGNMVLIDHGQGIVSAYRHLSKISVSSGQMVKPGQTIGLAGATGRVTGPHLHFDMRLSGAVVDPLKFIELSKTMAKMLIVF